MERSGILGKAASTSQSPRGAFESTRRFDDLRAARKVILQEACVFRNMVGWWAAIRPSRAKKVCPATKMAHLKNARNYSAMKRILSILLMLVFGLGPLAEALPASTESRLPACCRRHGAHHCAMKTQALSSSAPSLALPSHCPYFPGPMAASTTQLHAMATGAIGLPMRLAQACLPAAGFADAQMSRLRTRSGRDPPSSLLD